jgi:catechol 2,3-dioxygenase-like lactoylglutathione lyase family enzyme
VRPEVSGVIESALYVADLARSIDFYETILGFRSIFANDRMCAMSVHDRQIFLLFKIGASLNPPGGVPGHDGHGKLHVAFSIARESLDGWRDWLEAHGVAIESTVDWGRGGTSLYFRDPDDHSIELVTPGTWEIY